MVAGLDAAVTSIARFAALYQDMVDEFRAAECRPSRDPEWFGADGEGIGPMLDRMLDGCRLAPAPTGGRRLAGLVAPHLDYPRGGPCYLAAYRVLAENGPVERAVILGTNHHGRGTSVVATGKDFRTPLGTTRTDRAFLTELEHRCGTDLRENEFDHVRGALGRTAGARAAAPAGGGQLPDRPGPLPRPLRARPASRLTTAAAWT